MRGGEFIEKHATPLPGLMWLSQARFTPTGVRAVECREERRDWFNAWHIEFVTFEILCVKTMLMSIPPPAGAGGLLLIIIARINRGAPVLLLEISRCPPPIATQPIRCTT